MQIYLINLKKQALTARVSGVVIALAVLIATAVGIVTDLFREELYIEAAAGLSEEKIIIVDAGHGGEDGGAIGKNGVYEKDINLAIALLLGEMLTEQGYTVVYTRTDDRMLYKPEQNIKGLRKISDLKNRVAVAENYPGAVFVSIHMNSFGVEKYSGLQAHYSVGNEKSRALAQNIQDSVRENLQTDNTRKIKEGRDIYLLENIKNTAVLIECGFLSNVKECERLSEKEYQKSLCFAIVCGIIEYMNT